jgi:hypothetical protein
MWLLGNTGLGMQLVLACSRMQLCVENALKQKPQTRITLRVSSSMCCWGSGAMRESLISVP